jgi:hypothetical protein
MQKSVAFNPAIVFISQLRQVFGKKKQKKNFYELDDILGEEAKALESISPWCVPPLRLVRTIRHIA